MDAIHMLEELKKYPIFSVKELSRVIKKPDAYLRLVVHRLKKRGLSFKIEKNKYTVIKDPMVFVSRIVWPSYISCWQALRYYNLTEQLPGHFEVITPKKRKRKKLFFNGIRIEFIAVKKDCFFGYQKVRYQDFEIFMAEPEKAIIDGLLFGKISFSELKTVVQEHLKEINVNKLSKYLMRVRNRALIKRFGYLFDELGRDWYGKFKKYIDNNYVLLEPNLPARGGKAKKWMVIKNV